MKLLLALALLAHAAPREEIQKLCTSPALKSYPEEIGRETQYLCRLPDRVRSNVPEVYWLPPVAYQAWLKALPTTPSAPMNFKATAKQSDAAVDKMVLDPKACHFFSSISPSVQKQKVDLKDPRTHVVLDAEDLLARCRAFSKRKGDPCSVVEFAGHSTQAASLDTVFGVEEKRGVLAPYPSAGYLKDLGKCLRDISQPGAHVVFSTCGGDLEVRADGSYGPTHYWPGKEKAQKELASLLGMPVLSGVGFVDGTPAGGVTCEQGWHLSRP